ncbi:MAG: DUF3179 domain-containing protein [Rhizobiaceae bacterium]|nr:DUF3179 domain-containing protein [Rhizobiaceae bacterium]
MELKDRTISPATVVLTVLLWLELAIPALANPEVWAMQGWRTDFSKSSVDFTEILSGGPPKDGIPSIDDPEFRPASTIGTIGGKEPVIRLEVEGEVRAYPLQVLTWHEIANDVIGGVPVAVTYCPLCNAALVFDRRLDGEVLEFGTTGKLRNSDLVMYDRQTESWWQQFTGEAIVGEYTGERLKLLPSRIVSFEAFLAESPDAPVLVPNDPNMRDYGRNPYASYDSSAAPFLYSGDLPDNIAAMARVVVVRGDGQPLIVSLDKVRRDGFSAGGIEIAYQSGVASALDARRIAEGRDVGTVQVTRDGRDVVHDITFAFVAHAFHPDVPIITD